MQIRIINVEPHRGAYIRHGGETYRPYLDTVFPENDRVHVEGPAESSNSINVYSLDGKIREEWKRTEPGSYVDDSIPDGD